jgi:mercuric ion transport protein
MSGGRFQAMSGSKTVISAAGAVVAALAASACCIGPLVLAVLGLGGAASALALAPYRPWLLGASFLLLGAAFYLTYRRPAACAPDEACAVPRLRQGRLLLWLATLVVLLAAASPLLSSRPAGSSAPEAAPVKTALAIQGMSCGACVSRVNLQLKKTRGVTAYEVSLEKGTAEVAYDPALTGPAAIAASVSETGFRAAVKDPEETRMPAPQAP